MPTVTPSTFTCEHVAGMYDRCSAIVTGNDDSGGTPIAVLVTANRSGPSRWLCESAEFYGLYLTVSGREVIKELGGRDNLGSQGKRDWFPLDVEEEFERLWHGTYEVRGEEMRDRDYANR